jgi:iron-sulfur cluster insertion protein
MITITEKAVGKIKEFGLAFDNKNDSDTVISAGDIEVLIDQMSSMYLSGAEVDYVDGLQGAGFRIINPNAKSSCGCGHSFSA